MLEEPGVRETRADMSTELHFNQQVSQASLSMPCFISPHTRLIFYSSSCYRRTCCRYHVLECLVLTN
ncbi:hypothetical protein E2C01_024421 [Portunus trituberculatus]|uniref:Uncharacterized protein n=1 Tax=Portunus trituberculatus TaxID=210409 RepID=A0A5B7EAI7_PORTR|nr:hypothetical protein [Portunus trituberculatus]